TWPALRGPVRSLSVDGQVISTEPEPTIPAAVADIGAMPAPAAVICPVAASTMATAASGDDQLASQPDSDLPSLSFTVSCACIDVPISSWELGNPTSTRAGGTSTNVVLSLHAIESNSPESNRN